MSNQTQFRETTGAEAIIKLVDWFGKPAVSKTRIQKAYRADDLDRKLRFRRTKEEARLLHAAKLTGICVPELYFVDSHSSEIVMERVDGTLLKDIIDARREKATFRDVGESAARLHQRGIIHGDLTPKNIILSREKTFIIDFGLSFISDRLEDKAEDLHLLKQSIRSSEKVASRRFGDVLSGYESTCGKDEIVRITKQIAEIERRGRYARVD